ncbi:hypothetical protein BD289DRAFT_219514 [Coniella lustricola]|uniref:Uncharacterized protein n=1 Tax=Coniella lustricola TaxID=2025994 RepID=A0A2T3ALJ5_9PEZI|nr:hypothetical protein BD289DRAFT_219514 [Coniella lustricola]
MSLSILIMLMAVCLARACIPNWLLRPGELLPQTDTLIQPNRPHTLGFVLFLLCLLCYLDILPGKTHSGKPHPFHGLKTEPLAVYTLSKEQAGFFSSCFCGGRAYIQWSQLSKTHKTVGYVHSFSSSGRWCRYSESEE